MLSWLKESLPNRLYARAALILVAPVVVLTLAVTIAFLQRHFEEVTQQLTHGVVLEARVLQQVASANPLGSSEQLMEMAETLDMFVTRDPDPPAQSDRPFYDISGLVVIATLRDELSEFIAIDLASEFRRVTIWVDSPAGPLRLNMDRERVSASNPHQLVLITLFVGGLMSLVSYVFLRNQLRPIKRLSAAAEAFGKGRTLPYKPAGALEVRAAGLAFLDMRDRIERQIEQRTLMLSGVSHDLRTPLTRMKLELSMLEPGPEVDALKRDLTEMEGLLEAFLEFSKSASLEDMVEHDAVKVARDAVGRAQRMGQKVTLADGTPEHVNLPMRHRAVSRSLDNLIGNAARYASEARVSVELVAESVAFIVEDDGPGIPVEQREEAAKPFARLDRARNQNKGSGVGLGLAIVADIARSHGGALKLLDSVELGGLKAVLVLPR